MFDLVATPIALVFYGYAPSLTTAALALAVVGSLYIGILAGLQTTVQLRAPAEFRGRVLSIHLMSLGGIFPIGGIVQGWIGDRVGLGHTMAAFSAAMLIALAYLRSARPHVFRNLGDAPRDVDVEDALLAEPEPA